jgi:hypothetical protein
MKDHKYVLVVFNNPDEEYSREPKEFKVLSEIAKDSVRGASCGAINLSFFVSELTKDEIAFLLSKEKVSYMISEEKDLTASFPKYITRMLDGDMSNVKNITPGFDENLKPKSKEKVSLKTQLDEALKTEDFIMAAALRDKIAKQKPTKESSTEGSTLQQLFEE